MLNDFYHMLNPVAISAGPITIYWYGLAYVVGALLTAVVMYRTQRRWGFNITIDDLTSVVVGVVFGLIIGARLFYVVFYGDGYYWAHPLEIFATNEGGMSFHGGLVGGIIGGIIVCRMYKLDAWTLADLAVIGAPLALCLGRCANFVNGELWGKPTDLPWGVVFGGTAGDMPRHPSQLYEAFLEGIVLFCILQVLSRKKPLLPQGTFMGVFVMGYGIVRFLVEFVRVPDAQLGYLLGSSSSPDTAIAPSASTSTPNRHKGGRHLCGGLLGNDDRTVTFPQIKPAKINLSLFGRFLERLSDCEGFRSLHNGCARRCPHRLV